MNRASSEGTTQLVTDRFSIGRINAAHIDKVMIGCTITAALDRITDTAEASLFSSTDGHITVPSKSSPLVEHLLERASAGEYAYLLRRGQRIAAVLPALVAESLLAGGFCHGQGQWAARPRPSTR
jgi:hypothetical protein